MAFMFRTLRADEIECRVGTCTEKGVSLLLYKDARCDMMILDETVGAMNWQRKHSRDNANCAVGIRDADSCEWIWKEDTGTESNTEAEKGLASDSFKRACVNWGIGRELYTAPFIWISANDCNIGTNKAGKPACNDRFEVEEIDYDDQRRISVLKIKNAKTGKRVFVKGGASAPAQNPVQNYTQRPKFVDTRSLCVCDVCGSRIDPFINRKGVTVQPEEWSNNTFGETGKVLCVKCYMEQRKAKDRKEG